MNLKIGVAISGLIVSIIMIVTVAIPVIEDATVTDSTFINSDSDFNMAPANDGDSVTLTISGNEIIANTNSGDIMIPLSKCVICVGDDWIVEVGIGNQNNPVITKSGGTNAGTMTNGYMTIEYNNGQTKIVRDAGMPITTTESDDEPIWLITKESDYIMKKMDSNSMVLGDSLIISGISMPNYSTCCFILKGTINDGLSVNMFNSYSYSFEVENLNVSCNTVSSYKNLYDFESVNFTGTFKSNDTQTDVDLDVGYAIIPKSVNAELANPPDASIVSMLSMIPIILCAGLVIVCLGALVFRGRD